MNKKEIEGFVALSVALGLLAVLWYLLRNRSATQSATTTSTESVPVVGVSEASNSNPFSVLPEVLGGGPAVTTAKAASALAGSAQGGGCNNCGPNVNNPGNISVSVIDSNFNDWLKSLTEAALSVIHDTNVTNTMNTHILPEGTD